jgi:hypothetical protein
VETGIGGKGKDLLLAEMGIALLAVTISTITFNLMFNFIGVRL